MFSKILKRFCTETDSKNILQCLKQNKNSELMDPKCKQMITKRQITQNTGTAITTTTHTLHTRGQSIQIVLKLHLTKARCEKRQMQTETLRYFWTGFKSFMCNMTHSVDLYFRLSSEPCAQEIMQGWHPQILSEHSEQGHRWQWAGGGGYLLSQTQICRPGL